MAKQPLYANRYLKRFDNDMLRIINTIQLEDGVLLDYFQRHYVWFIVFHLKRIGVWDKTKALYGFIGGTAASHRWNWKDMRDLDEAYRLTYNYLAYAPTHSPQGIHFNNNSLATVTMDARNIFEDGNASLGYYSVNNVTSDGNIICADPLGNGNHTAALYINYETFIDIDLYRAGGGGRAESRNNGVSKGFTFGTRTNLNDLRLYKDSILKASNSSIQEGNVSLLNTPLVIGGNIYTFRSDSIGGFAFIGYGLTHLEAIQMSRIVISAQAILNR